MWVRFGGRSSVGRRTRVARRGRRTVWAGRGGRTGLFGHVWAGRPPAGADQEQLRRPRSGTFLASSVTPGGCARAAEKQPHAGRAPMWVAFAYEHVGGAAAFASVAGRRRR